MEPSNIISHRIKTFDRILKNIKEEIEKSKIKGDIEQEFKNFIFDIIESLESELPRIILEIGEISDQKVKIHRSNIIHRIFEAFLYNINSILRQNTQVPIEPHYFIKEDILSHLHGYDDLRYLLISGPDLETTNFSDGLIRMFSLFPDTQRKISSRLKISLDDFGPTVSTSKCH